MLICGSYECPCKCAAFSFSWGMIRNIQCMPYNKKARGSLLAFIFYEWAGDNQSLWGCRISQPLWQIENHSASLCYVTHLRCWQENEEIKDFPFVRRLLLFFFYVSLQHNRMELLRHKCSQWSRRITETIETMFKSENHFQQQTHFLLYRHISYCVCTNLSAACLCFDPPPAPKCRCVFPVLWRGCDVLCTDSEALKTTKGNESFLEICRKLLVVIQSGVTGGSGLSKRIIGDRLWDV